MDEKQDTGMESLIMDHFSRRPPINIAFRDVKYNVTSWHTLPPQKKEILHGISGEFRSGELTAIMGPSGAGKSTLLNILAGFTVRGSSGEILINGENRRSIGLEEFKKVSCYIQQQDVVRPLLRVSEAMSLATHLKLGCSVSAKAKHQKILELLRMLSLDEHSSTMCGLLSGGQKKRLSIALELITNPPVIFLDEPTTGLDSVSTTQCVMLMKRLARQGRTMVCTLHQPSAKIFEQFSQVYCIAEGHSLYQGLPEHLNTFMSNFGLVCPTYHNPADFLIEIAVGDYPRDLRQLVKAAEKQGQEASVTNWDPLKLNSDKGLEMYNLELAEKKSSVSSDVGGVRNCLPKPASVWLQLFHLYYRNVLIMRRDLFNLGLRFIAHIMISLVFGVIYNNVGNNAETILGNGIYVYGSNLFLHYTSQMSVLLSFPLEYESLTREHFNRWYTLPPYCLALLLIELPIQASCVSVFIVLSYYLTGQPYEWSRFGLFMMFNQAICFTAQGTGFLAGALLPVTIAVFLAPVFSVFFSVFGFTCKLSDITYLMRPFHKISYFRSAFQGSFVALYGHNRTELPCYERYCHYKKPIKFLVDMEFAGFETAPEVSYILAVGVLAYVLTAITVWFKLNKR